MNKDEVLRGLLCNGLRIRPNHPGGIANIYRERTIEEMSVNEEGLTSSNLIKLIG